MAARKREMPTAALVFQNCVEAVRKGVLIVRETRTDKEFHFQNWFKARLDALGLPFKSASRNSYPDFRMVESTTGFELKGLQYPGRTVDFDSNSQLPTGHHDGLDIFYVFGRYPKDADGNSYPVLDLVICHGSFLNANKDYAHKNVHIRNFGSYGDIKIRDRKMYVVPTPYQLLSGTAHRRTLVLPKSIRLDNKSFIKVGEIERRESERFVVGYSFDLRTNEMDVTTVPNPNSGAAHQFTAWRLRGDPSTEVKLSSAVLEAHPE